jgi:uncharacterized protein
VLIALAVGGHMHYQAARHWLAGSDEPFATCPITEGSLVRHIFRQGGTGVAAKVILAALREDPRHQFWPDDFSYGDVPLDNVVGHAQVTDAYLVALARHHGARLATFDGGLARSHSDAVELIPTR